MNTYQVTWYPPISTTPGGATVRAAEFIYDKDAVMFFDDAKQAVFAVAADLHPVIQKTG